VATKDFLHDLVKIIGPKNGPPQNVQEKVLSMIQVYILSFFFERERGAKRERERWNKMGKEKENVG
jgi:hypothetical protein